MLSSLLFIMIFENKNPHIIAQPLKNSEDNGIVL